MLKLVWRLVSADDSLWAIWTRQNLLRNRSLWAVRETNSTGSWMWRKILKYRVVAKKFHRVEVTGGRETSFWHDQWSSLGNLFDLLGARGSIEMGISSQCSVADVLTTHRRRRHRVAVLNKIEDEIDTLRQRTTQLTKDKPLWRWTNDSFREKFSSQVTWNFIRQANQNCAWYKGVWFSNATPKYSFTTWIAMHNRLATGDRLLKWNAEANGSCVFCATSIETRNHLFFTCPFSAQIWSTLARGLLTHRFSTNWDSLIPLLTDQTFTRIQIFVLRYVFQNTIYSIWRERNRRRHGETPLPATTLTGMIDKGIRNRLYTMAGADSLTFEGGLRYWFSTHSS